MGKKNGKASDVDADLPAGAESSKADPGPAAPTGASVPAEPSPESMERSGDLAAKIKAAREMPTDGRANYDFRYCEPCVFVDNDGEEYDARLLPLPTNKGELMQVPAMQDPFKEIQQIHRLPSARRAKALVEYNRKLMDTVPAMAIRGEEVRLVSYQGRLMYAADICGREVPCANLMVNFSRKGGEDWKPKNSARPKEFVPHGLPTGIVPHFYFKA